MQPGKRNLITDVAGLYVGQAEDHTIKTGASFLVGDRPFVAAGHVMGGAPGTRETELLAPDKLVQEVDALVLSGGSAFGLDAASGVADALRSEGRGFPAGNTRVPIVPGAILFDLMNGGNKDWDDNPYKALGATAYANRSQSFALGSHGAGTGATTHSLKGGIGSASLVLENGLTVGARGAANPWGDVATGPGRPLFAGAFEIGDEFGGLGPALDIDPTREPSRHPIQNTNTALANVATDAALTQAQAARMATAAHDGMARAIIPTHTPLDGDIVFAAATGEKPISDPVSDPAALGHAAAVCVTRAIGRAIYEATPSPTDLLPTWRR